MCSWPENLCTPGVVQCTVFYMLWHFRTLEGKEKGVSVVISCYICATVCGWARIFMHPWSCAMYSVLHVVAFSELKKGNEKE